MFSLQKAKYLKPKKEKKLNRKILNKFNQKDIDQLINLMSKASKPVFYTGGGVINSGPKASELLRELVSLNWISYYINPFKDWELIREMIISF